MNETEKVKSLSSLVSSNAEGLYLVGGKCMACEAVFFPKREICPRCTSRKIEESLPLSRRGKLYTFTRVYHKPPDYEGPTPYIIGRVVLPEGVFILTHIKGKMEDLRINMEMELVAEEIFTDADGNKQAAYKFKPAGSGQVQEQGINQ